MIRHGYQSMRNLSYDGRSTIPRDEPHQWEFSVDEIEQSKECDFPSNSWESNVFFCDFDKGSWWDDRIEKSNESIIPERMTTVSDSSKTLDLLSRALPSKEMLTPQSRSILKRMDSPKKLPSSRSLIEKSTRLSPSSHSIHNAKSCDVYKAPSISEKFLLVHRPPHDEMVSPRKTGLRRSSSISCNLTSSPQRRYRTDRVNGETKINKKDTARSHVSSRDGDEIFPEYRSPKKLSKSSIDGLPVNCERRSSRRTHLSRSYSTSCVINKNPQLRRNRSDQSVVEDVDSGKKASVRHHSMNQKYRSVRRSHEEQELSSDDLERPSLVRRSSSSRNLPTSPRRRLSVHVAGGRPQRSPTKLVPQRVRSEILQKTYSSRRISSDSLHDIHQAVDQVVQ